MKTLLLIIGLVTYDTEGGGGVSHININQQYNTIESCEIVLDKYISAYEKLTKDKFITITIAENSCTTLGEGKWMILMV